MGAVFPDHRARVISSHLDVSGQEAHLGNHGQTIRTTVGLNRMHVGELEGRVHSDTPIGTNGHNRPPFCLPVEETGGGHHDLLSDLPINILLD